MKWQYRLLFILLLTVFIVGYFVFKKQPQTRGWPTDGLVLSLFEPIARFANTTKTSFTEKIDDYRILQDTRRIDRELRSEIDELKLLNQALTIQLGLASDDKTVSDAFAFLGKNVVPGRILGYNLFAASKTVWIDRGEQDAVAVNDVVVDKDGLVGRVYQVYANSAKVLLLIDSYFAVDAMNTGTRIRSLVRGLNTDKLLSSRYPFLTQLEYIRSEHEMRVKDRLVTSGLGGIYPYGIPVGTVLTVQSSDENLFEKSLVVPAVDFAKLNRVYVLTASLGEAPKILSPLPTLNKNITESEKSVEPVRNSKRKRRGQ